MSNPNDALHPFLLAYKAQERLENVSALVWAQEIEYEHSLGWKEHDPALKRRALVHLKELALQKLSSLMVKDCKQFDNKTWLHLFNSLVGNDVELIGSTVIFPPLLLVFLEYDQLSLIQWWERKGGSFDSQIGSHLHMPELRDVKDCLLALGSRSALYRAGIYGVDLRDKMKQTEFSQWHSRPDKEQLRQIYLSGYELFLLEQVTGEGSRSEVRSL